MVPVTISSQEFLRIILALCNFLFHQLVLEPNPHTKCILPDGIAPGLNRSDSTWIHLELLMPICLLLAHFAASIKTTLVSSLWASLKAHPGPNVCSSQKADKSSKMLGELPLKCCHTHDNKHLEAGVSISFSDSGSSPVQGKTEKLKRSKSLKWQKLKTKTKSRSRSHCLLAEGPWINVFITLSLFRHL